MNLRHNQKCSGGNCETWNQQYKNAEVEIAAQTSVDSPDKVITSSQTINSLIFYSCNSQTNSVCLSVRPSRSGVVQTNENMIVRSSASGKTIILVSRNCRGEVYPDILVDHPHRVR